ncbi:MAG: ATP-binding cassette domain-containing protein, partial [Muribaculaceae bacterium]|nr:ATP-binding cassette domain-containing protein [Muribaculaceae bacterium]
MITLKDVSKVYRTKEIETLALENVNLEIKEGEFVSIMGPSGCGKSTLLNIIGLLDSPTTGTVSLLNTDTNRLGDAKLSVFRNSNIGFVFQSFNLIPSLNITDNVALPLTYRHGMSAS